MSVNLSKQFRIGSHKKEPDRGAFPLIRPIPEKPKKIVLDFTHPTVTLMWLMTQHGLNCQATILSCLAESLNFFKGFLKRTG